MENYDNTSIPKKMASFAGTKDPLITQKMEEWTADLTRLDAFQEYAELPITRFMLEKAGAFIVTLRKRLAEDRNLADRERDALFERIDAYTWYLRMFSQEALSYDAARIDADVERMLRDLPPQLPKAAYQPPNLEISAEEAEKIPGQEEEFHYPERGEVVESILSG